MVDLRSPFPANPVTSRKAFVFGSLTASRPMFAQAMGDFVLSRRVDDLKELAAALRIETPDFVVCEISSVAFDGLCVPLRILEEFRAGRLQRMPAIVWVSNLPEGVLNPYVEKLNRAGLVTQVVSSVQAIQGALDRLTERGLWPNSNSPHAAPDTMPVNAGDAQLISALGAGRGLRVVVQPQVELETGRIVGGEALIRWRHPLLGEIPASHMVQALVRLSLDALLFYVVSESVLEFQAILMNRGIHVRIAVNASITTLSLPGVLENFRLRAIRRGVSPRLLTIEITEDVSIPDKSALEAELRRFREAGFGLSMDDFGTGASNCARLTRLPFSELKIDRSFVRRLRDDAASAAVVDAALMLGKRLDLSIVAEGVEDYAQVRLLHGLGCEIGQGFGLGSPMEYPEFLEALLAQIPSRNVCEHPLQLIAE